jgi:hypothetical protein
MGWSPEYSRHYYVNATLGVSQWEPPPQQQSPATRSQKLPPIGISSLSKGKLKPANVEAAMRERDAMRTAESRQRALQPRMPRRSWWVLRSSWSARTSSGFE